MSPLSPAARWRSKPTSQSQSSFFARLPREIRDLIYHEVIKTDERPVHVFTAYDRTNMYRSRLGVKLSCPSATSSLLNPILRVPSAAENSQVVKYRHQSLTWVLTCQSFLDEVFQLFYYVPPIWIHDICTFESWWTALPPHSFNRIHALHLDIFVLCSIVLATEGLEARVTHHHRTALDHGRWATLWDTVAAMKGLETLHIKLLKLPHTTFAPEINDEIVEPFMGIKNLHTFTVWLAWSVPDQFLKSYEDKAPFILSSTS